MSEIRGKRGAESEEAEGEAGVVQGFEDFGDFQGGEGEREGGQVVRELGEGV